MTIESEKVIVKVQQVSELLLNNAVIGPTLIYTKYQERNPIQRKLGREMSALGMGTIFEFAPDSYLEIKFLCRRPG